MKMREAAEAGLLGCTGSLHQANEEIIGALEKKNIAWHRRCSASARNLPFRSGKRLRYGRVRGIQP